MTDGKNVQHDPKTNLTAGQEYRIPIQESFRYQTHHKPMDHLVVYNGTDKLVLVQLNDDEEQRYPCPASGGRIVINPEDKIKFSEISLINTDGANAATGTLYVTYGLLEDQ